MEWSFEELKEQDLLVVRTEGACETESMQSLLREIGARRQAAGLRNLLVDRRASVFHLETVAIYDFPARLEKAGIGPEAKIALAVVAKTGDDRFLETVLRNRGYDMTVFEDVDEALRWLRA